MLQALMYSTGAFSATLGWGPGAGGGGGSAYCGPLAGGAERATGPPRLSARFSLYFSEAFSCSSWLFSCSSLSRRRRISSWLAALADVAKLGSPASTDAQQIRLIRFMTAPLSNPNSSWRQLRMLWSIRKATRTRDHA